MVSTAATFVSLLCLTAWRVANVEASGYYTTVYTSSQTFKPAEPTMCTSSIPANANPYAFTNLNFKYNANADTTKMCMTIRADKSLKLSNACAKALAKSLQSITFNTVVSEVKQVVVANKNCAYTVHELQTVTTQTPYAITIKTKLTSKNANKAKVCLTLGGYHNSAASFSGGAKIQYSLNAAVKSKCCVAAQVVKVAPPPAVVVVNPPVVYQPPCACSHVAPPDCYTGPGTCNAAGACVFSTPKCSGSTPFCINNVCYQCQSSSNCAPGYTCENYTCVPIKTNPPLCGCPPPAHPDNCKVYSTACNSYGGCSAPTDKCSGATPACLDGKCYQCVNDGQCPGQTCNTSTYKCEPKAAPPCTCTTPPADKCKVFNTGCDAFGVCKATNKCQHPTPACSPLDGTCYECIDNSTCGPYVCNVSRYQCESKTVCPPANADPCSVYTYVANTNTCAATPKCTAPMVCNGGNGNCSHPGNAGTYYAGGK